MEQATFVWLDLSTAVIGGLIILVAGFLLGLGCGIGLDNSGIGDDPRPKRHSSPPGSQASDYTTDRPEVGKDD